MFAVIAGKLVVFVYIVLLISVGWYALLLSLYVWVGCFRLFVLLVGSLYDFLWCWRLLVVILVVGCFW